MSIFDNKPNNEFAGLLSAISALKELQFAAASDIKCPNCETLHKVVYKGNRFEVIFCAERDAADCDRGLGCNAPFTLEFEIATIKEPNKIGKTVEFKTYRTDNFEPITRTAPAANGLFVNLYPNEVHWMEYRTMISEERKAELVENGLYIRRGAKKYDIGKQIGGRTIEAFATVKDLPDELYFALGTRAAVFVNFEPLEVVHAGNDDGEGKWTGGVCGVEIDGINLFVDAEKFDGAIILENQIACADCARLLEERKNSRVYNCPTCNGLQTNSYTSEFFKCVFCDATMTTKEVVACCHCNTNMPKDSWIKRTDGCFYDCSNCGKSMSAYPSPEQLAARAGVLKVDLWCDCPCKDEGVHLLGCPFPNAPDIPFDETELKTDERPTNVIQELKENIGGMQPEKIVNALEEIAETPKTLVEQKLEAGDTVEPIDFFTEPLGTEDFRGEDFPSDEKGVEK